MRTEFDRVYVTKNSSIAVVTLNHPEVLNATSVELANGLREALRFVDDTSNDFRAAVLTGEGKGFCSGAHLAPQGDKARPPTDFLEAVMHPLLRQIRDLRLPIVAAVNGPAAGVGMSLAISCDLVVAARSAYFLQAFARIALVPDGGSTWLLPRTIGLARAKELSLLAEKLPAEKALEWGLINRVCDDAGVMTEALALAERLANGPTQSLAMIRNLYVESLNNSYEDQLDLEHKTQKLAFVSEDFTEGVMAFLEKRPAQFKGK